MSGSRSEKSFVAPGHHRTVAEFREHLETVDPELGADDELLGRDGPLGQPRDVLGRTVHNRFAIHPMEGWDAEEDGTPSPHTVRRWQRFGSSGAQLIWGGEAFAVQADGRANPHQLFRGSDATTRTTLTTLIGALRDAHRKAGDDPSRMVVGLQLTHSGRFCRPDSQGPAPRIAYHHPVLDPRFAEGVTPLTDGELEAIGMNFVHTARLAAEAGFDFVDVKCCHGYLLHELLGARARPGPYGGCFENRTRLFRSIVEAIRRECPGLHVAVRLSVGDIFPHAKNEQSGAGEPRGWESQLPWEHGFGIDREDPRRIDLGEPFEFLALLRSLDIELVNVTLGSPYYCPHLQRPATFPPSDGYRPPEDPLAGVASHLQVVRACRQAEPELVLVGTGYSYLQQFLPHVAQHEVRKGHVDFVGLGRMILSYPDLPRHVLDGALLEKKHLCRTFSDCTTAPRHGLVSGCYPLDPYYKKLPEAAQVKAIKKSLRHEGDSK